MLGLPQELSRKVVISSDINEQMAGEIVALIMEINDEDYERGQALKGYQPEPIEMFINSPGGNVTDGFAIIDAMEMSDTPIVTYGMGSVGSMALAIFVSGDIRISTRHTRFMYHNISYGMMGHIEDHVTQMDEAELIQRMYNAVMYERTKFTKEKLADIRKQKKDFFFSPKQAIKFGVVDEIMEPSEKKFMKEADLEKLQAEEAVANIVKEIAE
jgi:ATP-dependent Clp protease protease subunit